METLCGRRPFVLGVGKAAAACSVTSRLARHDVGAVLLFGVAGAYPAVDGPPLQVLDLALVAEQVFGDEGVATPSGFLGVGELGLASELPLRNDPALLDRAAAGLSSTRRVRCATVSTCSGIDALALERAKRTEAAIETMESAAVALACRRYAVPLLEVRCISNRTGDRDRAGFELMRACLRAQEAAAQLFAALPEWLTPR